MQSAQNIQLVQLAPPPPDAVIAVHPVPTEPVATLQSTTNQPNVVLQDFKPGAPDPGDGKRETDNAHLSLILEDWDAIEEKNEMKCDEKSKFSHTVFNCKIRGGNWVLKKSLDDMEAFQEFFSGKFLHDFFGQTEVRLTQHPQTKQYWILSKTIKPFKSLYDYYLEEKKARKTCAFLFCGVSKPPPFSEVALAGEQIDKASLGTIFAAVRVQKNNDARAHNMGIGHVIADDAKLEIPANAKPQLLLIDPAQSNHADRYYEARVQKISAFDIAAFPYLVELHPYNHLDQINGAVHLAANKTILITPEMNKDPVISKKYYESLLLFQLFPDEVLNEYVDFCFGTTPLRCKKAINSDLKIRNVQQHFKQEMSTTREELEKATIQVYDYRQILASSAADLVRDNLIDTLSYIKRSDGIALMDRVQGDTSATIAKNLVALRDGLSDPSIKIIDTEILPPSSCTPVCQKHGSKIAFSMVCTIIPGAIYAYLGVSDNRNALPITSDKPGINVGVTALLVAVVFIILGCVVGKFFDTPDSDSARLKFKVVREGKDDEDDDLLDPMAETSPVVPADDLNKPRLPNQLSSQSQKHSPAQVGRSQAYIAHDSPIINARQGPPNLSDVETISSEKPSPRPAVPQLPIFQV